MAFCQFLLLKSCLDNRSYTVTPRGAFCGVRASYPQLFIWIINRFYHAGLRNCFKLDFLAGITVLTKNTTPT